MSEVKILMNLVKSNDVKGLHLFICDKIDVIDTETIIICLEEAAKEGRENIFYYLFVSWIIHICLVGWIKSPFFYSFPDEYLEEYATEMTNKLGDWFRVLYVNLGGICRIKEKMKVASRFTKEQILFIFKRAINDQTANHLEELIYRERLLLILLKNIVKRKDKECLEILINSKKIICTGEALYIIINSQLEDRYDIIKKIITNQNVKKVSVLNILRNVIFRSISPENLIKILPFYRYNDKDTRAELRNIILTCAPFQVFRYGIELSLFDLPEDVTISNLDKYHQSLNIMMGSYELIHNASIEDNENNVQIQKPRLLSPANLKIIFSYIRGEKNYLNSFLIIIFEGKYYTTLVNDYKEEFRKFLELLLIKLENSNNLLELSQEVLNSITSAILEDPFSSYKNIYIKLINIIIQRGYVINDFEITDEFLRLNPKNIFQLNLIKLLLEISSQKQYNNLNMKIIGNNNIMSLKAMSRWIIKRKIGRPFEKNLNYLMDNESLPFSFRQILSVEKELDNFISVF